MTGRENRTVTLLYWPVASWRACSRLRCRCRCEGPPPSTGCSVHTSPFLPRPSPAPPPAAAATPPLHYSVINSIYLRPVQRRVHPCRNLSVCRASLSPARLVANSRPFRNREEPSILITRAVVRRFKTPLHTIPSPLVPALLGSTSSPPPRRVHLPLLCVSLFQHNKRLLMRGVFGNWC